MRRWQKILSIFLSVFILNSVFGSLPIRAISTTPDANIVLTFNFADTSNTTIVADETSSGGNTVRYTFGNGRQVTADDFVPEDIPANATELWAYQMQGQTCKASSLTGSDKGIWLAIGKLPDNPKKFSNLGIYIYPYWDGSKGRMKLLHWTGENAEGLICSNVNLQPSSGDNLGTFARLASDTYRYKAYISWQLTSDDKNKICLRLVSDWGKFKDNMRDLFIPVPGSKDPPQTNWEKKSTATSTTVSIVASLIGYPVAAILEIKDGYEEGSSKYANFLFHPEIDYDLTEHGKATLSTTLALAQEMRDDLDKLGTDSGTWPCPVQLTKFKWGKSSEKSTDVISSVTDLRNNLDKLLTVLKDFIKTTDQPVTSDNNNVCKSKDSDIVSMLKEAVCGFTVMIKELADATFNWAVGLMTQMIGLAQNDTANISDTAGSTGSTATPISDAMKQQATNFCASKKASTATADWSKGPCLSRDLNSSGYALDAVHVKRQAVDDKTENTCSGLVKWIEVNIDNCQFVGQSN